MVYKCRLSFHTSHTTPAATAIPPRVQSRRCRGFNPRRSWVSVSVSVCVLSPLVVCNSVLAASRLLDSPDSSLCSSIVCPVVCVCRPASVLRRVWVVSRLSGGVPVTGSVGLSVSTPARWSLPPRCSSARLSFRYRSVRADRRPLPNFRCCSFLFPPRNRQHVRGYLSSCSGSSHSLCLRNS